MPYVLPFFGEDVPYFLVVCQMPTCEIMFSAAQIGGKLKVFLLGAIYTGKSQMEVMEPAMEFY